MACYHPIKAYRGPAGIVFQPGRSYGDLKPVNLPCGRCIGCRLERSRQWAVRMMHEASAHEANSYVTLTYDDDHLPDDYSVDVRHWQLFFKKLKSHIRRRHGGTAAKSVKFYHCGEYGERGHRPHYHAIIFGYQFPELKAFKRNKQGDLIYTSQLLTDLWGRGHATTGHVTFESCAYVARYVTKKITGDPASEHYQRINPLTGELVQVRPEYSSMSNGIGKSWYLKFRSDAYPSDFITFRGRKMRPPRAYDKWHKDETAAVQPLDRLLTDHDRLKLSRVKKGKRYAKNNTPDRLKVREEIHKARASLLKRNLDEDD